MAQSSSKDDAGNVIALEQAWNGAIEGKGSKVLVQLLAPSSAAVNTDGSLTGKGEFFVSIKDPSDQPAEAVC